MTLLRTAQLRGIGDLTLGLGGGRCLVAARELEDPVSLKLHRVGLSRWGSWKH